MGRELRRRALRAQRCTHTHARAHAHAHTRARTHLARSSLARPRSPRLLQDKTGGKYLPAGMKGMARALEKTALRADGKQWEVDNVLDIVRGALVFETWPVRAGAARDQRRCATGPASPHMFTLAPPQMPTP